MISPAPGGTAPVRSPDGLAHLSDTGVPASPPGCRPTDGAASVSTVPASIPNADFTFGLDFEGNSPVKPHAVREAKGWRGEISGLTGGTIVRVWQSPKVRERLAQAVDDARKAMAKARGQ